MLYCQQLPDFGAGEETIAHNNSKVTLLRPVLRILERKAGVP